MKMKKIAALLAACAMMTACALGAMAEATPHTHAFCGGESGCLLDHVHETIKEYEAITSAEYEIKIAGAYYLANDIEGNLEFSCGADETFYLCLNGKTITCGANKSAVYVRGGNLVLCDCKGNGTITHATVDGVTAKGSGVQVGNVMTMYGGTISGNTQNDYANGGGVYAGKGMTMYGGRISGNKATGENGNGGGIYVGSGDAMITGKAVIENNEAKFNGGGVYARSVTVSGEAKIEGKNKSQKGGGVYANSGDVTVSGEAMIKNNEATFNGGGVYTQTGSVTISGGTISGNTASSLGGGVYSSGGVTMIGGAITSNRAGSNGGGVMENSSTGTVTVSGLVNISGNTNSSGTLASNVNLDGDRRLILAGLLDENSRIGVSIDDPKDSKPVVEYMVSTAGVIDSKILAAVSIDGGTTHSTILSTDNKAAAIYMQVGYTAPTAKTPVYSGEAQELVTEGITNKNVGQVQYALGTESGPTEGWSTDIPKKTEVGTYYVWHRVIYPVDNNYSKTYVIKEQAGPVTVTIADTSVPSIIEPIPDNLTYNGVNQPLVKLGKTSIGTMQYTLGTATRPGSSWGTESPKGEVAGTYYVWYRVINDANTVLQEPECVTAEIKKQSATAVEGKLTVFNNLEKTYEFDLMKMLPSLSGENSYGLVKFRVMSGDILDAYGSGDATVDVTTLKLPIKAVQSSEQKEIGYINIRIETDNYAFGNDDVSGANARVCIFTTNKAQNPNSVEAFTLTFTRNEDGTFTAVIPATEGCEYSFDGVNWSDENTKDGCAPGEQVTGYKRFKETDQYLASEAVQATGEAPSLEVQAGLEDLPQTGDPSSLLGWVCLLTMCAGAALVMKRARA